MDNQNSNGSQILYTNSTANMAENVRCNFFCFHGICQVIQSMTDTS